MARKLQGPSKPRFPDPPVAYDATYMRQLVAAIENAIASGNQPSPTSFTVTTRTTTALSLDVATATLAQTSAFLGELAAALVGRNIIGGNA